MTDWKLPWSASCLCGRVTMQVTQPPVISMACHCRGCQKLTSGPYSLTLMIPESGFSVTSGETIIGGLHREDGRQHYCPHCLNWLYTMGPALEGLVNFRATMLDDATWVRPFIDTMAAERLPGVVSGAVRAYPAWPAESDHAELTQAYARDGAKPQ
ncbi:MAG: GFA family protein [Hyphomonadaceae bacterium]